MKWLRRILGALLGIVILAALVIAGVVFLWMPTSLPQTTGEVTVPGLAAPVQILRDADGIVTIRAQNDADAAFALGYAHAQDRLVQMEMMRRLVAGRLSEVIGSMTLSTDRTMRVLGLYRTAEHSEALLPDDTRTRLEAYAAGVNAYIDGHSGAWPPEFEVLRHRPEPWRVADSLAWGRIMALRLSNNYWMEYLRYRLSRKLTPDELNSLMPLGEGAQQAANLPSIPEAQASLLATLDPILQPSRGASNSFAVSGSRTASGAPILANDPHLSLDSPIVWYLVRIETPERLLVGATSPGGPFVIIGHNGHLAWSLTTTHSDTQDLFLEKLDPADLARYATPDGTVAFETHTETIHVRGGEDEQLTIRNSRHGPILSDLPRFRSVDKGYVLSLSWTGLRPDDRTATAIHRLNHAATVDEAFAALQDFHTPQQNFVLADTAGNIGFVAAGRVPVRKTLSANSMMPVPGWDGDYDWAGFLPFKELPQVKNPPEGFIATANSKITPEGYSRFITGHWQESYRQDRIREFLRADSKVTMDSAAAIMRDTYSAAAKQQLAALMPSLETMGAVTDEEKAAIEILKQWNFHVDRGQAAPLILTTWLREADKTLFAGRLGDEFVDYIWTNPMAAIDALGQEVPIWCRLPGQDQIGVCLGKLQNSFRTAIKQLTTHYGDDASNWRWGDAHQARFANALLDRVPLLGSWLFAPLETDGDEYTVNRGTADIDYESDDPVYPHVHGASMRAIFDLADLSNSKFMLAGGQSGNPFSPHYRDLLPRWRDQQYFTMVGQGVDTLTLRPAP
ncbi:MAG TPA: penicillin acylase family protein [Verrucomicrobiae bacterium]|nr:penicillin acylase family protein [Verrucomicrobiae bacterium]